MMSNEVKQRKKGSSGKDVKDAQQSAPSSGQRARKSDPDSSVSGSGGVDVRTLLCLICVAACGALTWLVYQQSQNFSILETKYQSLQTRSGALEELEDKIKLIFGKLSSTEDTLAEASSSSSVLAQLQQQLSSVHSDVDGIQKDEQQLSRKMQLVSSRFQNITDMWKKSLDQLNEDTRSLKSEAKVLHNQATGKINAADHTLKVLSEKLKEMEDSTKRNVRTVRNQEEEELSHLKEQLDWDTKVIEGLEKQQSDLIDVNKEINQNMVEFQPKLEECIKHLPSIESGVRGLLRVSNEVLDLDKKMNDLTVQVFNTEDNLLKVISEMLEVQHSLEAIQYDNSILKMQNDISLLKERTQKSSPNQKSEDVLEEETEPAGGEEN
ncbi:inhibitor of nuclear factor kappa-B kinase-interacting protein isoform X1 [Spea bombifrons]|uniref:inhibitor of nuclear factor kappa-B kinase-interacting protein isoform X1 n=1 Tax=Spea bombifrons TaxID=233779 RepID=UPI002349167D|nr:inhibitor of nuclear factor kappa-B kinase-interacting protein isoform X1 [Spea bombifrons]